MNLIICMAGFNTRFHHVGFDLPKYLLPWANKTIIHEILTELTRNYTFDKILLLPNNRDIYFQKQLNIATSEFSPEIYYIGDTLGQAHTAAIGIEKIDGPVLIHNADTILYGRDIDTIDHMLKEDDAFVDVFSATSPAYCYVEATDSKVTHIMEKKTITPYASSGLYGFKDAGAYLRYYRTIIGKPNEIYISDVLSAMLSDKLTISINDITGGQKTMVIGSPQEYLGAVYGA